MRARIGAAALIAALAGCAAPPDVPGIDALQRDAPWPQLVPVDQLRDMAKDARLQPSDTTELQARARALQQRADRLRRRVP